MDDRHAAERHRRQTRTVTYAHLIGIVFDFVVVAVASIRYDSACPQMQFPMSICGTKTGPNGHTASVGDHRLACALQYKSDAFSVGFAGLQTNSPQMKLAKVSQQATSHFVHVPLRALPCRKIEKILAILEIRKPIPMLQD